MTDNFYLGRNELLIRFQEGRHVVMEADEDWKTVFEGSYGQCRGYCENRVRDYQESVIG